MDEIGKQKLWEKYSKTKELAIKDQIIIEYAQLVKFVAGRLSMYLGNNVDFEDLCGYGVFVLIDAIDKFDYEKGVKFETYASLRIRGSILDNIRKMDWIPRSIRKKQKSIDTAVQKLETELGHTATEEEISRELGISLDEYYKWMNQTNALAMTSLEEFVEQGGENHVEPISKAKYAQPEDVVEKGVLHELLTNSIESLSEKEKKVIVFYYYEELTLKEISAIMGVSESRISQLHTKALGKMKTTLGNHMMVFLV